MPRARRLRPYRGTVFQRSSDGRWVGRGSLKVGGLTIRETVYGTTEREAVETLNKLAGTGPTEKGQSRKTVAQLFDAWFKDLERTNAVRAATLERYKQSARHIVDTVGQAKIALLTPENVRDIDRLLIKGEKSASQRERAYGALSAALGWAVRQELIDRNVCSLVASPRVPQSKRLRVLGICSSPGSPEPTHCLYELYENCYTQTVRKLLQEPSSSAKRAAPGARKPKPLAASLVLVNGLREDIGERRLSSLLRTIRDEVRPATRLRSADTVRALLRAENSMRVEAKRAAILADAVNSDIAGKFIARTRPVVNKLAKDGELLAVEDGRYLRFPRWQFDEQSEDGLVPGFRRVLTVMDASPFRKAAWFVSPNPHFGDRAPIELLREGEVERVYEEAKAVTSG
jgi:hypothetical protein